MKKLLIGAFAALTLVAFSSAQAADVKFSGFFQKIIGMGEHTPGGVTHAFNRLTVEASTTTDNGWEVGGKWANQAAGDSTAGPSALQMHVGTDMGTVTLGHTTDAVTNTISRVSAWVPGSGTDGGYQLAFFSAIQGSRGVAFSEAYYAMNGARVVYKAPSLNGINVQLSYTPTQDNNAMASTARTTNGVENAATHQETIESAANYSGELEGVAYTVAIGMKNGNGITSFADGNDLNVLTGSVQLSQGAWKLGYNVYDNGSSYGSSTDSTKASSHGWNAAALYTTGNITLGAGYAEQTAVNGTSYDNLVGGGNITGSQSTNITMLGIAYNLGGGVGTYVQMSDFDIEDGVETTSETAPQVIFAGISLGF